MTKPIRSYTIWFSQRTGSTELCKALQGTGIAGIPNEWLLLPPSGDMLAHHRVGSYAELQERLWQLGSTPNGVCGMKVSYYEPAISSLLHNFRQFPGCPAGEVSRPAVWECAFPNTRHIFMTRRNKIRLAVSWWKAIQTQEWHRRQEETEATPRQVDLEDAYAFDAINHLLLESTLREAGMQEFFSEGGITPLTIVYEDFIQDYPATVRRILDFLDLDSSAIAIPQPHYHRLADDLSEAWVQRFRQERQAGWNNRGW